MRRVEAEVSLGREDEADALIDELLARDALPEIARSRLLRQRARMLRRAGDTQGAVEMTEAALTASAGTPYDRALCLAQLAAWQTAGAAPARAEAREILTALGVVDIPALLRDPARRLDSRSGDGAGLPSAPTRRARRRLIGPSATGGLPMHFGHGASVGSLRYFSVGTESDDR